MKVINPILWKPFLVTAFIVSFFSCNSSKNSQVKEFEDLAGTVIAPDTGYYDCFRPFILGDKFVTKNINGDFSIYAGIFEGDILRTGTNFARKGQGPMEFGDVYMAQGSDSSLYVMNGNGGHPISIVRIPFHPWPKDGMEDWTEYRLDSLDFMTCQSWVVLSDSTALLNSAKFNSNSIFSVLDFKNAKLTEMPWLPEDNKTFENSIVKQGIYTDNSFLFRHSEENGDDRFLYTCGSGAYSMIFKLTNGGIEIIKVLSEVYPDYWEAEDGLNYYVRRNTSELIAATSSKRIFLLEIDRDENGKTAEDRIGPSRGDIVHVYDWNGNFIKDYKLDRLVLYIFASPSDNKLYAMYENHDTGEQDIIRYDL